MHEQVGEPRRPGECQVELRNHVRIFTCTTVCCKPLLDGGQEGPLDGFLFPSLEPARDTNTCVLLSLQPETYAGALQKEMKTNAAFNLNIRRKVQ